MILFGVRTFASPATTRQGPRTPCAISRRRRKIRHYDVEHSSAARDSKKYIIETTGTGVAIFDYDNDGWPDIFLVNGTTLEGRPQDKAATNHLYRNNHDGTFTDVTTARRTGRPVRMGTRRVRGRLRQ